MKIEFTYLNLFGQSVLAIFCILTFIAYLSIRTHRALMLSVIGGFLFLPVFKYQFGQSPLITKMTLIGVLNFCCALLTQPRAVLSFRPKWVDLPIIIFCFSPIITAYANNFGWGVNPTSGRVMDWLCPYILGRMFLANKADRREFCHVMMWGAFIYIPLILFEVRISPQLHNILYGYMQHSFIQTIRLGGYRPMVFLNHGLMLGFWICMTSLMIYIFSRQKLFRAHPVIETFGPIIFIITSVLVKSSMALVQLVTGLIIFALARRINARVFAMILISIPFIFCALRISQLWDGTMLVQWLRTYFDPERAQSVEFRFQNENIVITEMAQHWLFGTGGGLTGGSVSDRNALAKEVYVVFDGFWIITYGSYGVVGLLSMLMTLLLPVFRFIMELSPVEWVKANAVPTFCLILILLMYTIDHLQNAMISPILTLALGSVTAEDFRSLRTTRRARGDTSPMTEDNDLPSPPPLHSVPPPVIYS